MLDLESAEWAVKYIDTHLRATLSVTVIAAARGVDASDLERAFRRTYHVTTKSCIEVRSMEVAIDRLRAGECRACDLAEELGFNTDQQFHRWIKRMYHLPFRQLKARYQGSRKRG
jgi:methylphosphotriester-DNA--protein-cysteine methyltransferase